MENLFNQLLNASKDFDLKANFQKYAELRDSLQSLETGNLVKVSESEEINEFFRGVAEEIIEERDREESGIFRVKRNGFSQKLSEYVLGDYAPIPDVTNNGCPIFWLWALSYIIAFLPPFCIIFFSWKFLVWMRKKIILVQESYEKWRERKWFENLRKEDKMQAEYFSGQDIPAYVNYQDFITEMNLWFEKEENSTKLTRDQIRKELIRKWEERRRKEKETMAKLFKAPELGIADKLEDATANAKRRMQKILKQQAKLIKFTKRFVGLLITTVLAAALIYVLNFVSWFVVWIYDGWNTLEILGYLKEIGIVFLAIVITVGIVISLIFLMKFIYDKTPSQSWVGKLPRGIIWPFYAFFYLLLVKIICVEFLWKIIFVWLLWGSVVSFWNGLVVFGSLVKEYGGKAKTDVCPEATWVD